MSYSEFRRIANAFALLLKVEENIGYEDVVLLPLNRYQASNLLWLLKRAWTGGTKPEGTSFTPANSGDWCGEIPQVLERLMKATDLDLGTKFVQGANSGGDPYAYPRWTGKENIWDDGLKALGGLEGFALEATKRELAATRIVALTGFTGTADEFDEKVRAVLRQPR
jgi:hypothetical protein